MNGPVALLRRIWFALKEQVFLRRNTDRKGRFSAIYAGNLWKNPESASGYGSTVAATGQARAGLEALLADYAIDSILDAPCGDFNWMQQLDFAGSYTGGDIVPALISENQRRYGSDRRRFVTVDLVAESLPPADLVLCRECLNHLSLAEAGAAIDRLETAARRLLVLTHYPGCEVNVDQSASFRYRHLNFTIAPFFLRPPDRIIDECESEAGKVLAIWIADNGPLRG